MKKLNLIALLLMTLFTMSLTSCGDDNKEEDVSPNTALLTAATWSGDAIYIGQFPAALIIEKYAPDMADELGALLDISDWKWKFERNGTFTATMDGTTETGKWVFADNEKTLILTADDGEVQNFAVNSLTETALNLEASVTDLGYDPEDVMGIDSFELRFKK